MGQAGGLIRREGGRRGTYVDEEGHVKITFGQMKKWDEASIDERIRMK